MHARRLSFAHGWSWLRLGVQLWKRNPAFLTFISFTYLLILLLLTSIPLIGQPAASLLMPVLSLGVLTACRAVDEGRPVNAQLLFSGFRSNVPALLMVGFIYMAGSLLVMLILSLLDSGYLMGVLAGTLPMIEGDPRLMKSFIWLAVLSTPLIMAYWFAPALVGWWKVPAVKAMFFSFVACARNWRPFAAFSIALLVIGGAVPSILLPIAMAILPFLGILLMLILPLIFIPVLFASFYYSTCQVFQLIGQHVDERIE
jgi:hypothetical protein